jgi:pyridoxine 4-dehydrogenase
MSTVTLGGDRVIQRMGFGAMRLCGPDIWGEPDDPEAARAVLRRVVELGINFIDTADAYGPEVNELQIADALYPYPDDLVIATKGSGTRAGRHDWGVDGSPRHLREACEASLQRLRLECIELYQLHGVDDNVAIEESIGALAELQVDGKIRHIGVSNVDEAELVRAQSVAPIASVQNRFSVADRSSDPVVHACELLGLVFFAYFPIGAGWRAAEPPEALQRGAAQNTTRRRSRSRSPGSCSTHP